MDLVGKVMRVVVAAIASVLGLMIVGVLLVISIFVIYVLGRSLLDIAKTQNFNTPVLIVTIAVLAVVGIVAILLIIVFFLALRKWFDRSITVRQSADNFDGSGQKQIEGSTRIVEADPGDN